MQEDLDIKISMLLDGELHSEEALEIFGRIRKESDLRAKWLRYNTVSCASRGNTAIFPDAGFLDRVSKALEYDETMLESPAFERRRLFKQPTFLTALAASVMLVAVIVWSGVSSTLKMPTNHPGQVGFEVAKETEVKPRVVPVSVVPAEAEIIRRPTLPRRLNDYLITHNESAYTTGTQTMMPHARVISYSYDQ